MEIFQVATMEFLSFWILVSIIAVIMILRYVKNNPPGRCSATLFSSPKFGAMANRLEDINVESTQHEPQQRGQRSVFSKTKLTNEEISRISVKIGEDWDKLAGLLNIPYNQQEEIRLNTLDYPSNSSKAEKILLLFNESKFFSRNALKKFFKELGRNDLEIEMLPVTNQSELRQECCEEQIESEMNHECSGWDYQYVNIDPPGSVLRYCWRQIYGQMLQALWNVDFVMKLNPSNMEIEMIPMKSQGKMELEYWERTCSVDVQTLKFFMASQWCLIKKMFFGDDYGIPSLVESTVREPGQRGQKQVFWNTKLPPNKEVIRMAKVTPKRMRLFNGLFSVLPYFLLAFWVFSGAVNSNVQDHFGQKAIFWCTKFTNEGITQTSVKDTDWDKLSVCLDIPYYQQENRSIKNPKTIPKKSQVANIRFNRHSPALLRFVLAFFLCGPVNTNVQEHYGQNAVLWNTRLTYEEIMRMSVKLGPDWDRLAALMDIPYNQREEIRLNSSKYPSFYSKAKQVFVYFNKRRSLTGHHLNNFFKELGRYDLENEMMPVESQGGSDKKENAHLQEEDSRFDNNDNLHLRDNTPLSPREMYRLSLHIPDWNALGSLMNISSAERNDIRNNSFYPDNRSQAEKVLWIFNTREDFSREKLTHGLKEISLIKLIKPVINGEWRSCELRHEEREEQLESGLKPEDHREKFEIPERIPRKEKFARNPSNRRSSWFPRFLLAFLLSSVVNNNIPERYDEKPILWNTELTSEEMSVKLGADWDKLAGLMDIPYSQRDEIRLNYSKYPSLDWKAEAVFVHFNKSKDFSRHSLKKFFKELGRHDLGNMNALKHEGCEEQFENGLRPEDRREKFKVPQRSATRTNFSRIPSSRRFSVFPRFVLAFLLSSTVNNSIQVNYDAKPILWDTKLTCEEITRMSVKVGADWDKLAGLMDIPYYQTEEIRLNYSKYPNLASKAEAVFVHFNKTESFSRHSLKTFFKDLGRHDLKIELISVGYQSRTDKEESASSKNEWSVYENSDKPYLRDNIRLSSREICKLGGDITDSWYILGGLLNINFPARNNIQNNVLYHDNRSRAEKILSIFNNREDFSRLKLANLLKEISQPQLVNPVITGKFRNVTPKRTHFAHRRSNRNFPALLRLVLAVFLGSAVNNNVQDHYGEKPVLWNTKLGNEEIIGISLEVGADWDKLAGLMNIPYNKREEIRFNSSSFSSKAEQILRYYNESKVFSRHHLKKIFKEMGRFDLETQMASLENQSGNNGTENASTRSECSIYASSAHLQGTPLSSREMCRLSQKIVDWNTLAAVMNIPSEERNNIRNNNLYYDDCSRAEKILSLFNNREDFSRETLASHFEEISELYLKNMVETGELRSL